MRNILNFANGGEFDSQTQNCIICANFKKTCVMYPCGHLLLCNYCTKEFKDRQIQHCPVCNKFIRDIMFVYN